MNRIIILTLFTFYTLHSDCGDYWFSVFPYESEINENSFFLIESSTTHINLFELLKEQKHKFVLVSKNDTIELKLKEFIDVGRRLTQSYFEPTGKLKFRESYNISILYNNIDSMNLLENINYFNETYKNKIWRVTKKQEKIKPIWVTKPKLKEKIYAEAGCGDIRYLTYKYIIWEYSEYVIKAYLKDNKNNKIYNFYLFPDSENLFKIGTYMCSGEFDFKKEQKFFEVWFEIIDLNRNITDWKGSPIKFTKPDENDLYKFPEPPIETLFPFEIKNHHILKDTIYYLE